jgi:hypothetical protein
MAMPIGRYVACVGTALLGLLLLANWFQPQSLAEPAVPELARPVIRIVSVQQPPERIVIDTNLPTIVPPLTPGADAAPDDSAPKVQSHLPTTSSTSHTTGAEKKKLKKKRKHTSEVAAKAPPSASTILSAKSGTTTNVLSSKLPFANIISGQLMRELFNLH